MCVMHKSCMQEHHGASQTLVKHAKRACSKTLVKQAQGVAALGMIASCKQLQLSGATEMLTTTVWISHTIRDGVNKPPTAADQSSTTQHLLVAAIQRRKCFSKHAQVHAELLHHQCCYYYYDSLINALSIAYGSLLTYGCCTDCC